MGSILIGTVGWEHKHWHGDFYDERLPDEWRFCYFSNLLRAAVVPYDDVQNMDDTTRWVEDSDPNFRMVLEVPAKLESRDDFLRKVAPLMNQVDAFLVSGSSDADVGFMHELRERRPVCVDAEEALMTGAEVSYCWYPARQASPAESGDFLLALSEEADLRKIKAMLQKLEVWGRNRCGAGLFFYGSRAWQLARQAREISELMGI